MNDLGVEKEILSNLILELRRGTLVLSVLSQLKERQYGYSLVQRLSEHKMEIDQGTLYPLLRRLEKQGLLKSDWTLEESRPRRYYELSEQGKKIFESLTDEWNNTVHVMKDILS